MKNKEASLREKIIDQYDHWVDDDLKEFDFDRLFDDLENIKNKPLLFKYIIECLSKQDINTPQKYQIIIHMEIRKKYDEKMWSQINKDKPFEEYKKACVDGDFNLYKEDIIFPKVFDSISDAESFASNIDKVKKEIPSWSTYENNENILFEKYSIKLI